METNLVVEGVKFMFLGMGTVFIFLIMMIFFMKLLSWVVHTFFPKTDEKALPQKEDNRENKKRLVAAITAAIIHDKKVQG